MRAAEVRQYLKLKGGDPMEIGAQVQSDGTIWTQNSDGTLTQLR